MRGALQRKAWHVGCASPAESQDTPELTSSLADQFHFTVYRMSPHCLGSLFWTSFPESVSTNGSKRPKSQTWHRLAVWTVGALVAGIRSKTRV